MDVVPCPICHNFFNRLILSKHQKQDHSSVYSVKPKVSATTRTKRKKKSVEEATVAAPTCEPLCEGMILRRYLSERPIQQCHLCEVQLPTAELEEHTLTNHGIVTVTLYKCSSCDAEFESESLLLLHKETHTIETLQPPANSHTSKSRSQDDDVICAECNLVFAQNSELVIHRFVEHGNGSGARAVSGGRIQCHDCDQVFSERKTLYWHRQEAHLYRCQQCNDSFSTQVQLSQHLADLGPHQCQFECTECGASFDSKIRLKHHRDRHTQKFQCEICKKNLSTVHSLNCHIKSKHSGNNKPFKCKICKKAFPYSTSLRYHMRTHGEKQITCQFCGLKFHFAFNYKRHVELNHGRPEDKVVCEHCGGFYSKVKLRDHLARHGEATLPCNLCGKKFRLKEQLQRHKVQQHMEKRPHTCPVCSRGFVKPESLGSHYARKHREVNPNFGLKQDYLNTA